MKKGAGLFVLAGLLMLTGRVSAEESGDTAGLSAKLDKVLANQSQIMQKLDAISEELSIVKVRATNR